MLSRCKTTVRTNWQVGAVSSGVAGVTIRPAVGANHVRIRLIETNVPNGFGVVLLIVQGIEGVQLAKCRVRDDNVCGATEHTKRIDVER